LFLFLSCRYYGNFEAFIFQNSIGIERPQDVPRPAKLPKRDWFRPPKEKGTSTLRKWVSPECNLKVRMGRSGNPELTPILVARKRGKGFSGAN
jgi:hypothetical protein